jgi:hypothetical protein
VADDAAERLDAIRNRAVSREVDIKTLDAAIVVAKQNVEVAKRAEAAEAERLALTELSGLANVLRAAGKQADAALSMLGEAAVTMGNTVTAINRLGVSHPSYMHMQSLGERAVKTALIICRCPTAGFWVAFDKRSSPCHGGTISSGYAGHRW